MRYFFVIYLVCTIDCIAQNVMNMDGKSPFVNLGKIYLYRINEPEALAVLIDSAFIIDGSFHLKTMIEEPCHFYLKSNKHMGKFSFIWDNDILIRLGSLNMANSTIERSPASDDLESFKSGLDQNVEQSFKVYEGKLEIFMKRVNQKDTTNSSALIRERYMFVRYRSNQIRRFISTNPASWTSLFLLCWYRYELGRGLTHKYSRQLSQQLQESKLYSKLDLALQGM